MLFSKVLLSVVLGCAAANAAWPAMPVAPLPDIISNPKPAAVLKTIPDYVKKYAPILYMHSDEKYHPSWVQVHLNNVIPYVDYTPIQPTFVPTMSNLQGLDQYGNGGSNVYLTAKKAINTKGGFDQAWLKGVKPVNGKSAPIICICVDKGNGVVDAFWMSFFSFNDGTKVVLYKFGNHVGDFEHTMIRFINGIPQQVYMSQHAKGQAFTWSGLEKDKANKDRYVAYIAKGSHAIYSSSGHHDHTFDREENLPHGPIEDKTNKGYRWDPLLEQPMYFTWDMTTRKFTPTAENPTLPTAFMDFKGNWGDKAYKDSASGQHTCFGESVYVGGPSGPWSKNLDRPGVCPKGDQCDIYNKPVVKKLRMKRGIWDTIKGGINDAVDAGKSVVNTVKDGAEDAGKEAWNAGKTVAGTAEDAWDSINKCW